MASAGYDGRSAAAVVATEHQCTKERRSLYLAESIVGDCCLVLVEIEKELARGAANQRMKNVFIVDASDLSK